jgi:tetratricopeptide (TPR) repeat protein
MATVLAQKGDYKDAIDEYTRSLYINPLSLEAYNALGSIFFQNPDLYKNSALSLFEQCARLFPNNKDVLNNLGYMYTKMNRTEDAVNMYKKALAVDPDFEVAKKNLKILLSKSGQSDKSLDEGEALMKILEDNVVAKNWPAAIKNSSRLAELEPRSFKARLYRANILFTIGRLPDAIAEYNVALNLNPSNPSAIANLGLAYFENKQYPQAKEALEAAVKYDPNNKMLRDRLEQADRALNIPR